MPDLLLPAPHNGQGPDAHGQNRWDRGAWLFRDTTLHSLEILLDEVFRIPGTSFRFGIDGIIGLVPGLGDVLAGLLSLVIPLAAWIRGVPYVTLVRMGLNLGIGVLVGSIPVLGDIFDIAWKANFLLLMALLLAAIFALPLVLFLWLLEWLTHR
jgi:hypothetical protein